MIVTPHRCLWNLGTFKCVYEEECYLLLRLIDRVELDQAAQQETGIHVTESQLGKYSCDGRTVR